VTVPPQPRQPAPAPTAAPKVAKPRTGDAATPVADTPDAPAAQAAVKAPAKKAPAKRTTTAGPRKTAAKTTAKTAAKKTAKKPAKRPSGPTDVVERELIAAGARVVAGVDEVGRGAWAGPVVVGAAVSAAAPPPAGLTDSKLLTAPRREALVPELEAWATAYAFGAASPEEIDELGMTAALRLAAVRALEALPVRPDAVVLDGSHDFLGEPWTVRTVVKGDQACIGVAAASVLAKVYRDGLMAELGTGHPAFAFCDNAGYPSPTHRKALEELGPTPFHRMSWAFLDDLPQWRHLKKFRTPLEDAGQTALDF
jgi:ribonuclease HII